MIEIIGVNYENDGRPLTILDFHSINFVSKEVALSLLYNTEKTDSATDSPSTTPPKV